MVIASVVRVGNKSMIARAPEIARVEPGHSLSGMRPNDRKHFTVSCCESLQFIRDRLTQTLLASGHRGYMEAGEHEHELHPVPNSLSKGTGFCVGFQGLWRRISK